MNWSGILGNIIAQLVVATVTGGVGLVIGIGKGKKKSSNAIERKNEIYQPLVDEISKYSNYKWDILETVKMPKLIECVENSYKYGFNNELLKKMQQLYDLQESYKKIRTISVAHNILSNIFRKGYTEIYGSIVDGIAYHTTPEGDEWEEEIIAEPVQCMEQSDFSKELESLLINEGNYSEEIYIEDGISGHYEPIYSQLKRMYSLSLNIMINGEKYKLPSKKKELSMLPEEYIAYHYDFFEEFNNNEKIIEKYKLRAEIIELSGIIEKDLKDIISKIVKLYEIEQI